MNELAQDIENSREFCFLIHFLLDVVVEKMTIMY